MNSRVVAAAAAVLLLAATPTPSPSPAPIVAPSIPPGIGGVVQSIINTVTGNAIAPLGVDPNHVRGTVTYFRRYDLQVQLPLNKYEQVRLHQGTIINPRGATLGNGQFVDVRGRAQSDGSLDADEITIVHG